MGYIGRYFLNSLYNSVHISDDHNSNSSELLASTKCVNNAVSDCVKTVNGNAPDSSGNTVIDVGVKTVNGNAPDAAGNITPAQTGCLPLTGGIIEGNIYISRNGVVGVLGSTDFNDKDYRFTILAASGENAASFQAFRQDSPVHSGAFICRAMNANGSFYDLAGHNDGSLTWRDSPVLLPPGAVFAFAGNFTPGGCLICNGAEVSRTTYAELYTAIGTTYGAGNGSTTFNLPNLTDRFIQGSDTGGTVKNAGLPNITGALSLPGLSHGDGGNYVGALYYENTGAKNGAIESPDVGRVDIGIDASRSSSIYGASTTVQPPALTMRYYIKY